MYVSDGRDEPMLTVFAEELPMTIRSIVRSIVDRRLYMRVILAAALSLAAAVGLIVPACGSPSGSDVLDPPIAEALVISDVAASPAATSVTITWQTNLPADTRVDYGTAPGSLLWSKSDASMVTAHSLMVMNLLQGVTYFFRVVSTTGPGEAVIFPSEDQPPLQFTTIGYDVISAAPDPGAIITPETPCLTIPIVFAREDDTPVRAYSVTLSLSENLDLCGAEFVSSEYPVAPLLFLVTPLGGNRWRVDETTMGWPCGAVGTAPLFTVDIGANVIYGTGTVTIEAVAARDCVNGAVPALAGGSVSIPINIAGDVEDLGSLTEISLQTAVPNPFVSSTAIRYRMTAAGPVELTIYSADGRILRVLENGMAEAGEHVVTWDGTDRQGRRLPSGLYLVRLRAVDVIEARSLIRLR
jgi:hypothetical protein